MSVTRRAIERAKITSMLDRQHSWRFAGLAFAWVLLAQSHIVGTAQVLAMSTDPVSGSEIEAGTDSALEEPSRYGRLEDLRFRDGDDRSWAAVDYDD